MHSSFESTGTNTQLRYQLFLSLEGKYNIYAESDLVEHIHWVIWLPKPVLKISHKSALKIGSDECGGKCENHFFLLCGKSYLVRQPRGIAIISTITPNPVITLRSTPAANQAIPRYDNISIQTSAHSAVAIKEDLLKIIKFFWHCPHYLLCRQIGQISFFSSVVKNERNDKFSSQSN